MQRAPARRWSRIALQFRGGKQTCLAGTCQTLACTPNSAQCANATTLATCKPDGTGYVNSGCKVTEGCTGGVCKTKVCVPNEHTCQGKQVALCNDSGTVLSLSDCSDSKQQCIAGKCGVVICAPGSFQCSGASLQTCSVDGTQWNSLSCDDANPCTVGDTCKDNACLAGPPLDCDDGNACTDDSCVPSKRICAHSSNTLACEDGDPCTENDMCSFAKCVTGTAKLCDDKNICTDDQCELKGNCTHYGNVVPCNDGNFCTENEACKNAACTGGSPKSCDDNNVCSDDSCDPKGGCVHKANALSCDDANSCTDKDGCANSVCSGLQVKNCDDGDPCTSDACDAKGGCIYSKNTAVCDDGNACTENDVCKNGLCTGGDAKNCDDNNACTDDSCEAKFGCKHAANVLVCNDGNACTEADACKNGGCSGKLKNCDDADECTDDLCDVKGVCLHSFNTAPCSDLSPCTVFNKCNKGNCEAGPPKDCNDNNLCTDDSCDGKNSNCIHVSNVADCNDGNACTVNDKCKNAICNGGLKGCDDSNLCTDDACNAQGVCTHSNNAIGCDDGNVCSASDLCANGVCSGKVKNCDDNNQCTDDSCNNSGICVHANNAIVCNDGNACTSSDACAGGICSGKIPSCDDKNPCTLDGCDVILGCTAVAKAGACDDGDACTTGEACGNSKCQGGKVVVCDDNNPCTSDACDKVSGCVTFPIDGIGCSDGNACTGGDKCSASVCKGVLVDCDDKSVCTIDACDISKGCTHTPQAGNCDDNDTCTINDACSAGVCKGVQAKSCDDGNSCTVDGCKDAVCTHTPAVFGTPCDTGVACTVGACNGGTNCVSKGDKLGERYFGGAGSDSFQDEVLLADGTLEVTGAWQTLVNGPLQGHLTHVNTAGGIISQSLYDNDSPYIVRSRGDGTFRLLTGSGVVFTAADGSKVNTWPNPGGVPTRMAVLTSGVVVASGAANNNIPWLGGLDVAGKQLFSKTVGSGSDSLQDIIATADGKWLAVGTTNIGGNKTFWLVRGDSDGVITVNTTVSAGLALGTQQGATRALELPGGALLLAGDANTVVNGQSDIDVLLIRADAAGNKLWAQVYKNSLYQTPVSATLLTDGGFAILAQQKQDIFSGNSDMLLLRTDALGNLVWKKTLATPGGSLAKATAVLTTADGGLLAVGNKNDANSKGVDGWLGVMDAWGNGTCALSGACISKKIVDCADGNPCTADLCSAAEGGCNFPPMPSGSGCGNGKSCNAVAQCL